MTKKTNFLTHFSILLCLCSYIHGIFDIDAIYKDDIDEKELADYVKNNWDNKESDIYKCFFNTQYIANSNETEKLLLENHGFSKKAFITEDGFKLESLTRIVNDPEFTIIVSAGFLPGQMTGMATLVAMLPKNCNIIFYNNRGKGNSQGRLFSSFLWGSLRNYGVKEYKDVIGALKYAHEINNSQPIFMYGICAGAFNTVKALCKLDENKELLKYNIKGLILDSPVTSVQNDLKNIPMYTFPKNGGFVNFMARFFLWSLRYTIFHPWFMAHQEITTLNPEALATIGMATLYFNSKTGDPLTTYVTTNDFYEKHKKNAISDDKEKVTNKCFSDSKHALHHLKHKVDYVYTLANFIKKYAAKN